MTFRITTTAADAKEARRVLNPKLAAARANARHKGWRGLLGWALFVCLISLLFLLGHVNSRQAPRRQPIGRPLPVVIEPAQPPLNVAATWAAIGSVPLLFLSTYAMVVLARRPLMIGEVVVTVGEDGLCFERSLKRERLFWASFTSFAETDHLFVLRETKLSCRFIPKRAMTPEEVNALRERLAEKLLPPVAAPAAGSAA